MLGPVRRALARLPLPVVLATAAACAAPAPPPRPAPHAHAEHSHHAGHGQGAEHARGAGGPAPLVHRFENAEAWAREFDDPARDEWQKPREVIAAMKIAAGMVVADIGAGTGYFEPWLSRAVGPTGAVLALDVEPDMVRYLGERAEREGLANVRPSLVATDDPKLPAASVDMILVVDTWHHVSAREAYARKLREALKPGGKLFVVDFKLDAKHGPPPHHRLSAEQISRELAATGFAVQTLPAALPEQYVVEAARP